MNVWHHCCCQFASGEHWKHSPILVPHRLPSASLSTNRQPHCSPSFGFVSLEASFLWPFLSLPHPLCCHHIGLLVLCLLTALTRVPFPLSPLSLQLVTSCWTCSSSNWPSFALNTPCYRCLHICLTSLSRG